MNSEQLTFPEIMNWDEADYLLAIYSIEAPISHHGKPCPSSAMMTIASLGLKLLPQSSDVLRQIFNTADDGRSCPAGEIHVRALRELQRLNLLLDVTV